MLTKEEYESLLPYKEQIFECNAPKHVLQMIDPIRQRLGHGSICWNCSASPIQAQRDMVERFNEYEQGK